MPSFTELTSTRCPGCSFLSTKTRAQWALTFSVKAISLSFLSSCKQTSTLTVLSILSPDRPLDIVLLVPELAGPQAARSLLGRPAFSMGTCAPAYRDLVSSQNI